MKKTNQILFLMTLIFSQISLAQSPWTREKGKSYVQLGFSGIFFDKIANEDGKETDLGGDFSDITLQAYADYGITSKLEAQLIVPFKSVGYDVKGASTSESLSGIGNVSLGLKYKLLDSNWKLSSGLLLTPKTSQYDDKTKLSTGLNATTALPYVTVGSSQGKWYYFGNLGYGYMTNDYSDYMRLNAEVGYQIIEQGHLIFALDTRNVISKEKAFENDEKQTASFSDRIEYNAVGLKFNYEFSKDKFGVNAAAFGAFGIKNAPLTPSLNFGVYAKL
jgi:hypothetical protein